MRTARLCRLVAALVVLLAVAASLVSCIPAPQVRTYYYVSGRVTLDGDGLPGVTLLFTGNHGHATTNAEGLYSKASLTGTVTVIPSLSGYAFDPPSRQVSGAADDIDFSAYRASYDISGRVTGPGGLGLSGVSISFGGGYQSVLTDAQGYWSKSGLTGTVTVVPSLSGYTFTPPNRQVAGAASNVDFSAVSATYSVSGRVTDSYEAGISGVTISFEAGYQSVLTDEDGYWSKSGLSGTVTVTPSKPGYAFTPASRPVSEATGSVNFTGTYGISGDVVDWNDTALSGVTVSFSGGYASVVTDTLGRWSKSGLSGPVTVTPSMPGYTFSPASQQVSGPDTSVRFVGMPDQIGHLEGCVYLADWNVGLINATVTDIGSGQTVTTDDGYYALNGLHSGQRQIVVDALFNTVTVTAEVYGGQTSSLDIRVPFDQVTFAYFDELVQRQGTNGSRRATMRWPIGKSIAVYFDQASAPDGYTSAHREAAWSAVTEWPGLIGGGVISVYEVDFEDAADVIVRWVPPGSLGGTTIGLCTISYNTDYEVYQAQIKLDVSYTGQLLRSLMLHEFGHTLYLGHSPDDRDIMYPRLQAGVTTPSDRELEATRILYSIPTKILLEEPMRGRGAEVVRVLGGGGVIVEEVSLHPATDVPRSDDRFDGGDPPNTGSGPTGTSEGEGED